MALGGDLPSWLQINPRDFLLATQAGAQLGHTISEASQRAFENQQRMQMESKHQEQVQAQQAIENAMTRLAADRLENYRQQESKATQARIDLEKEGLDTSDRRADILESRANELIRHNQAMEAARQNALNARPEAGITTLPEAPGFTFLKNPSGALTPLLRPPRLENDIARQHLQLSALNAMAPKGAETEDMPSYQARTNAVGGILRSLQPQQAVGSNVPFAPAKASDRQVNTAYKTPKGVFLWSGKSWVNPNPPPTASDEPEDLNGQ